MEFILVAIAAIAIICGGVFGKYDADGSIQANKRARRKRYRDSRR
jgi:hypothetical protein